MGPQTHQKDNATSWVLFGSKPNAKAPIQYKWAHKAHKPIKKIMQILKFSLFWNKVYYKSSKHINGPISPRTHHKGYKANLQAISTQRPNINTNGTTSPWGLHGKKQVSLCKEVQRLGKTKRPMIGGKHKSKALWPGSPCQANYNITLHQDPTSYWDALRSHDWQDISKH